MKVYLISDTHFNHANIATYCDRPTDFTERIVRNWQQIVKPEDLVIHLGDVFIGPVEGWRKIVTQLPGRKMLVRGNHDRQRSLTWWMENGFDGACDKMVFRTAWLTHEPSAGLLPTECAVNIHGHLHNIWHGFHPHNPMFPELGPRSVEYKRLHNDWQRLFAIEYTNYSPVEFQKFVDHPDKYQARGPATSLR